MTMALCDQEHREKPRLNVVQVYLMPGRHHLSHLFNKEIFYLLKVILHTLEIVIMHSKHSLALWAGINLELVPKNLVIL